MASVTRQIREHRRSIPVLSVAAALLMMIATSTWAGTGQGGQGMRTPGLLQQSLQWIRDQHGQPAGSMVKAKASQPQVATGPGMAAAAIPLSSAPARNNSWADDRFFLRGEDHEAAQADRVRVGFEESRVPWVGSGLTVDGNWSVSQQPGDTTMDIGLDWQIPLGSNQLSFRGHHHEYRDEVIASDDIRQVSGNRQTLELDFARSLYQGPVASLDARLVTTDVSSQWFENGDLTGEARRSYSLLRLDGQLGGPLPWLSARGDLSMTIEGCMALLEGMEQEACGEKLGAFQRYRLEAGVERDWLRMDWNLHGTWQYTPSELPGWRYMEVGPGTMHGFGGQVLRGRQGGWLRLDSATPERLLWLPSGVRTNLRFSLLRGWAETPGNASSSRATVGEVLWRVSGDHLSGGLRAGTLLETAGPGLASNEVPDVSLDIAWTL